MSEANKPAYPIWTEDMPVEGSSGLTKREYFAAKAMQAYCSLGPMTHGEEDLIAEYSYRMADAMFPETERHNDMLALVERIADYEFKDIVDDARRILGRGE